MLTISPAFEEVPTVRAIRDRFNKLKKMAKETSRQKMVDESDIKDLAAEGDGADKIKTPPVKTDYLVTPVPTRTRNTNCRKRKRADLSRSESEASDSDISSDSTVCSSTETPSKVPRRNRMTLRHAQPKDYSQMIGNDEDDEETPNNPPLRRTESDDSDADFDLEADRNNLKSTRGKKLSWREIVGVASNYDGY